MSPIFKTIGIAATVTTILIVAFFYCFQQPANYENTVSVPATKTTAPAPVTPQEPVTVEPIEPIHPHKDTRWAKVYKREINDRANRYGVSSKPGKMLITVHKGGKRMNKDDFTATVKAVYQRMPHVKTSSASIALVVETAITESDLGRVLVLGDNYGVLQIQEYTARQMLEYLDYQHKDIYAAVEALRDKKYDLRWNLTYNVPYQIAMSITCYWHKLPNYREHIDTVTDRAVLWKSVYNTKFGKGTVEKYESRVAHAAR